MQIIILGMPRSGTSLTGQLMEALGFTFGPTEQAAKPAEINPLGFWERKDVSELNYEALAETGSRWETPANWTLQNVSEAYIQKFDAKAREIVSSYPPGMDWFLKDPKISLTFPLWEKHFDDPVYLIAYRNPCEISHSVWKCKRMPQRMVFEMWERHLADVLNFTKGKRRFLINYDELLLNPEATILDVVSQLERFGVVRDVAKALSQIRIDPTLRHYRGDSTSGDYRLTLSQESLDRRLREKTALDITEEIDVSGANRELLRFQDAVQNGRALWSVPSIPHEIPHGERVIGDGDCLEIGTSERLAKELEAVLDPIRTRAIEALENVHCFELFLAGSFGYGKDAHPWKDVELSDGNDQIIARLVDYHRELYRWNPLRSGYRKARRDFKKYEAKIRQYLNKTKRVPRVENGLTPVIHAVRMTLDDCNAGKLRRYPEMALHAKIADRRALVGPMEEERLWTNYLQELKGSAKRLKGVLDEIQTFRKKSPNETPRETQEAICCQLQEYVAGQPKTIAALLESGDRLSKLNPFSGCYREARSRFITYLQTQKESASQEAELRKNAASALVPKLVTDAEAPLSTFLARVELAIPKVEAMAMALRNSSGGPA